MGGGEINKTLGNELSPPSQEAASQLYTLYVKLNLYICSLVPVYLLHIITVHSDYIHSYPHIQSTLTPHHGSMYVTP